MNRSKARRADERRNHERLLEVAQESFAKEGLNVPINTIAERAGLGIATIYRHFPTKRALAVTILEQQTKALIDRINALDEESGFFEALDLVATLVKRNRHLQDALSIAKLQLGFREAFQRLLRQSQQAGLVRSDARVDDVLALVAAAASAPSVRRALDIVRDGLRPPRSRAKTG